MALSLDLNNPKEPIVAQRFVELDSTNTEALRQLRSADNRPAQRSFIISGHQTAGRGQAGNGWHDTPGNNLLSTLVYYPQQLRAADLFAITQVSSLAVVETVKILTGIDALIKWPNDILAALPDRPNKVQQTGNPGGYQSSSVDNESDQIGFAAKRGSQYAKLCGLLIQNSLFGKNVQWTIIGAGLNVNENNFPVELEKSAISLRKLVGHELDLSTCEATYAATLLAKIDQYLTPLNRIGLQRDYLARLHRLHEKSNYLNVATDTVFVGTIRDVDSSGQLVVEHRVGRLQRYGLKEIRFL
ncbi:hypothetical protein CEQ90_10940 [Lewinellaceae bacterium SD302]|nr:hypothetical protein CEQ90_10940 [Lewinellaceae bacterium SD302]